MKIFTLSVRKVIYFVLLALVPLHLHAERQVLLFGGGPTPNDSQVSIELNTIWISDILNKHYPKNMFQTFYTDGNAQGVDVHSWSPPEKELEIYQPIARVFNKHRKNGIKYRTSHIAESVGISDAENITATLEKLFSAMKQNDEVLLIYQGHGGYYSSDTRKNYFRLWGETKMTVVDLEKLMSKAEPSAKIRFIFPQCFSGAFSKLIYKDAKVKNGLANGTRCGFLAQREDRESEGCTYSVNTDEYRDYAYYFFSAIDGKTINGDPLHQNPDKNNDGVVTLREAHLYTLANAFSVDFSRSTSEDFLENWQPWYLKWVPVPHSPNNVYSDVAKTIASRFELMQNSKILVTKVNDRIKALNAMINKMEKEQKQLKSDVKKLQKEIKHNLAMITPAIEMPYTVQFRQIMLEDIDAIQAKILQYPRYPELVQNQDNLLVKENKILVTKRELVQMEKILRMRKLARILDQFENYANEKDKSLYKEIVQCENTKL